MIMLTFSDHYWDDETENHCAKEPLRRPAHKIRWQCCIQASDRQHCHKCGPVRFNRSLCSSTNAELCGYRFFHLSFCTNSTHGSGLDSSSPFYKRTLKEVYALAKERRIFQFKIIRKRVNY